MLLHFSMKENDIIFRNCILFYCTSMIYTLCIYVNVPHLKKKPCELSFKLDQPLTKAMLRHVLPDYDVLHENFVFWHVKGWAGSLHDTNPNNALFFFK